MKKSFKEKYLPEFVYGGIDGSITTLAVIAGAMGASLNSSIVLILGFANLIADGFSMAVSNYLSVKSQRDLRTHKREDKMEKEPLKTGYATFISFILIGIIPILPFILAFLFQAIDNYKFPLSIILTAVAFILVGSVKGKITRKKPFKSAMETLIIGGIAATLAFVVGYLLRGLA